MAAENTPMNIGSRVEMMIDHALIHRTYNVHLKLNPPTPREIVLRMEMPWEGSGSGIYSNVFFDGEKYRMHYRASAALDADTSDRKESQYNCLAVSTDGVHWERPILNQVEFLGNKENLAVIWRTIFLPCWTPGRTVRRRSVTKLLLVTHHRD